MWRSALSRPSRWLVCAVFLSSAIGTDALGQDGGGAGEVGGAELALVPVGSSAPHVINGNEITIPSVGATVELEIRASGLQQNGERCIVAYAAQVDSSSYSTGLQGTLTPAQLFCASSDDCFGESVCLDGVCDVAAAAFIDREREDFLFAGLSGIVGVDLTTPDYHYGAIMFFCRVRDSGYCGTLILSVPEIASGTFSVQFDPHPDTGVLYGSNQKVLPLTLAPALITIAAPVCGNLICEAGEDQLGCPLDCVEHEIPCTSEWGLLVMALLLLTVAKICRNQKTPRGKHFHTVVLVVLLAVALTAKAGLAQAAAIPSDTLPVAVDSGIVCASGSLGNAVTVYSQVVSVNGAKWIRLHFQEVQLAGALTDGNESYLRITSLRDGAVEILNSSALTRGRRSSAFFNGDCVLLELVAYPNAGENRVVVDRLLVRRPPCP